MSDRTEGTTGTSFPTYGRVGEALASQLIARWFDEFTMLAMNHSEFHEIVEGPKNLKGG